MMMFDRPDGSRFVVDVPSLGLNVIAFTCLVASWSDGIMPIMLAIMIWILDEIRHPNPIFMNVEEGDDEEDKGGGPPTDSPA